MKFLVFALCLFNWNPIACNFQLSTFISSRYRSGAISKKRIHLQFTRLSNKSIHNLQSIKIKSDLPIDSILQFNGANFVKFKKKKRSVTFHNICKSKQNETNSNSLQFRKNESSDSQIMFPPLFNDTDLDSRKSCLISIFFQFLSNWIFFFTFYSNFSNKKTWIKKTCFQLLAVSVKF